MTLSPTFLARIRSTAALPAPARRAVALCLLGELARANFAPSIETAQLWGQMAMLLTDCAISLRGDDDARARYFDEHALRARGMEDITLQRAALRGRLGSRVTTQDLPHDWRASDQVQPTMAAIHSVESPDPGVGILLCESRCKTVELEVVS